MFTYAEIKINSNDYNNIKQNSNVIDLLKHFKTNVLNIKTRFS